MRNEKVGRDGNWMKVRGTDETVSVIYDNTGVGFPASQKSFGIGPGYIELKNTATASLPSSPNEGGFVYDSTAKVPKFHNGTSWLSVVDTDSIIEIDEWTPVFQDASGSNDEGQSYADNSGTYFKIGNLVCISGSITLSDLGTLTTSEQARIAGLPYTVSGSGFGAYVSYAAGLNITAGQVVSGHFVNSASHFLLNLWDSTEGVSELLISEVSADGSLIFSGFYLTS